MKQFLDASGLNLYTQALKNGTLVVGRAQDSSRADYATDASTAFYASHASATGIIGIIPLANLPAGALERLVTVANKAARLALTSSDVQVGDTVQELDTKLMYLVVDESKLGSEDAFVEYTAGRATFAQDASHADKATIADDASHADIATEAEHAARATDASSADKVEWANVQNKPTEFKPEAHTHTSADVSALAGYAKAGSYTAIANGDSLNTALGKLEKKATDASNTADWGSITNKPTEYKPELHTQDGSTITKLTGYAKASSVTDVAATDTLLVALGKIEKKADDASSAAGDHVQDASTINMTGYAVATSYSSVAASDTALTAIEKVERKALDASNTADWGSITNKPTEYKPELHTQDGSTITKLTGYAVAASYTSVAPADSLETAIGKVEKKALDASNTAAWNTVTGKPSEFVPTAHDGAKVTSLETYTAGATGDVTTSDNLVTALSKIETAAKSGADQPIPDSVINSIVNGSFSS